MTTPHHIQKERISYTDVSAMSLVQAHAEILHHTGMSEDEWTDMMFEHGCRYASVFAQLYTGSEKKIQDELLLSKPEPGQANNFYWMWWRMKWMQDDALFIHDETYLQPVTYNQIKTDMLHSDILEYDLLNILEIFHLKK